MFCPSNVLINRHDSRMLELTRNARLPLKTRPERAIIGDLQPKFLQRDITVKLSVVRQPDPAASTCRMHANARITLLFVRRSSESDCCVDGTRVVMNVTQGLLQFCIVYRGQLTLQAGIN